MFQADFGDIMSGRAFQIHDELDGRQNDLVDIGKQCLGFVHWDDHRLWLSGKVAQWVRIRLMCQYTEGSSHPSPLTMLTDFKALILER